MDTDAHGLETNLTEAVIGSAFEVSKALGAGFLEKVYELAMLRQLTLRGVSAKTQASFPVCYQGQYVMWANLVPICINYLKASGLRVALLINFQRPKVEWKRVLLDP